ncbi:hypothetical protein CK203_028201 [Vitis vinifera]|uniref:Reverse transcriptase Ty1/copia-type domain-containing protein n=1 Tax=Vitis vinifera TaxID=29760 RepID=A0A438IB55_VITVI|nr:hypothetical protein CK203_028201 [Vitis vinifera]
MDEEIKALNKTRTWDLVTLHPGKFVVERYKARLVAKGFTWKYEVDYDDTFSLVARMASIHCLIVVDSIRG